MDFTTLRENLEKRRYKVSVFKTKKEAAEYLEGEIKGKTVGFGGSVTLTELGLRESLAKNNTISSHWNPREGQSAADALKEAMTTDVYLSSVNGAAETGELVNIDGTGNRVAGTLFGHKKVYLVLGKNKIEKDLDAAIWRARNVAAPKNAKRLERKTPCAEKADKCYDCSSPERICSALVVLWQAPGGSEYEVVLVDEVLGY